jgi:pilus assembly protein CpaE
MVAVDIAWHLAQRPDNKVALIDFDLAFGSVALALDIEPSHGLTEILEDPDRIDTLFVSSASSRVGENLIVLASEDSPSEITPAGVARLLKTVSENAACVIADMPRLLLAAQPSLVESADALVIVSEMNLVSARDAARLAALARGANAGCAVSVVANKTAKGKGEIDPDAFTRGAKAEFLGILPFDAAAAKEAANAGQPVGQAAPSSPLHRGIAAVADALVSPQQETPIEVPLWRRLLSK